MVKQETDEELDSSQGSPTGTPLRRGSWDSAVQAAQAVHLSPVRRGLCPLSQRIADRRRRVYTETQASRSGGFRIRRTAGRRVLARVVVAVCASRRAARSDSTPR